MQSTRGFVLALSLMLAATPAWAAFPTMLGRTFTGSPANETTHTVNFAVNPSDGDLLVVMFEVDGNPTVTKPTGGCTWNDLWSATNGTTAKSEAWWCISSGEGTSVTFTTSASEKSAVHSWVFDDGTFASGTPVEAATPTTATGTSCDPPSFDPSWGTEDTFWIAFCGADGIATATAYPSNYPDNQATGSGAGTSSGNASSSVASLSSAASISDPNAFTISSSQQQINSTIAIRPAGAAAPCKNFITLLGAGCS